MRVISFAELETFFFLLSLVFYGRCNLQVPVDDSA